MKTSVYVPDDLWARVKERDPDASLSQLIQQVLRDRVEVKPERPAYAELTPGLRERLRLAQERAREQVAAAYRLGYHFGLVFASGLQTDLFVVLVAADYDFDYFRKMTTDYEIELEDSPGRYFDFDDYWLGQAGDVDMSAVFDNGFADLPPVVRQGVVDAVRDVWEGAGLAGVPVGPTDASPELRVVPGSADGPPSQDRRDDA